MRNIILLVSDSVPKEKYLYPLYEFSSGCHEKSAYDSSILIPVKYKEKFIHLYIYNNPNISNRIIFDGAIVIQENYNSNFSDNDENIKLFNDFEEKYHKEFGLRHFPLIRIGINSNNNKKNKKSRRTTLYYTGKITKDNWDYIFDEFEKEVEKYFNAEGIYGEFIDEYTDEYDDFNDSFESYKKKMFFKKLINHCSLILSLILGVLNIYFLIFTNEFSNTSQNNNDLYINFKCTFLTIYILIYCKIMLNLKKDSIGEILPYKSIEKSMIILTLFFAVFDIIKHFNVKNYINKSHEYTRNQAIIDCLLVILSIFIYFTLFSKKKKYYVNYQKK